MKDGAAVIRLPHFTVVQGRDEMKTLLRVFDCMEKAVFAMQCNRELNKLYGKKSKATGLSRLTEMFQDVMGDIVCFGLLAYGIYKGWIKIQPYLGDGYDYDNF